MLPHPRHRIEIARGDQALPQRLHRPGLGADLQFGVGRHLVPPAARDQALIDLDRRLGRRHRVGRKHRSGLATDGNPLGGFVALAPFGLTVVRRLLGAGAKTRQRRPGQRANGGAGKKSASIDARKTNSRHGKDEPQSMKTNVMTPRPSPPAALGTRVSARLHRDYSVFSSRNRFSRANLWPRGGGREDVITWVARNGRTHAKRAPRGAPLGRERIARELKKARQSRYLI